MLDNLELGFQKIWGVELFEEKSKKLKTSELNVEKICKSENKWFFSNFLKGHIFFCINVLCDLKLSYIISWNNSPHTQTLVMQALSNLTTKHQWQTRKLVFFQVKGIFLKVCSCRLPWAIHMFFPAFGYFTLPKAAAWTMLN